MVMRILRELDLASESFFCLGLFNVPHRRQIAHCSQILFHICGRTSQYTWYNLARSRSDSKSTLWNLVRDNVLHYDRVPTIGASVTRQNIFIDLLKFSGFGKDSWIVKYFRFSWKLFMDLWIEPGFEIVFLTWQTFQKQFVLKISISASVGYLACSTTEMQANCNPSPFCNGAIAAKDACSHAFRNIFTCCFIPHCRLPFGWGVSDSRRLYSSNWTEVLQRFVSSWPEKRMVHQI